MGFKAAEKVEELSYDFNPHINESGVIPEPTSRQVTMYRDEVLAGIKALGLDTDVLTGNGGIDFDQFGELIEKSSELEATIKQATAELTGISLPTIEALPYRVQQAFLGWIMGEFFSPEA